MQSNVVILGSTGSIGENTLAVLEHLGPEFRVWGLSAHSKWQRLGEQVRKFAPRMAVIGQADFARSLTSVAPACRIGTGEAGMTEMASHPDVNVVVSAVVGAAGLPATLAAVNAGKRVAVANKEPLVMAGGLLLAQAKRSGATILPIDSEHSAVFQALQAGRHDEVRRVILTASGGPFRETPVEQLERVSIADALRHPNWSMGPKITIDSATMMNKALEVVEARFLFDLAPEQIEVVIHPESIIHSLVEFCDGSMIAQMGPPDMKTPIQYALTHPRRRPGLVPPLDLAGLGRMRFSAPDADRFPALSLGFEVARRGGTSGAVMNAANEVAVQAFLDGRIGFREITRTVKRVLDAHALRSDPDLPEILEADRWARLEAARAIAGTWHAFRSVERR